jgi:hypothetical protein
VFERRIERHQRKVAGRMYRFGELSKDPGALRPLQW